MLKSSFPIVIFSIALSACSVSGPVAVIAPGGQILRGTTTSTLAGGDFTVSGSGLTCTGAFRSGARQPHCLDLGPMLGWPRRHRPCATGRPNVGERHCQNEWRIRSYLCFWRGRRGDL